MRGSHVREGKRENSPPASAPHVGMSGGIQHLSADQVARVGQLYSFPVSNQNLLAFCSPVLYPKRESGCILSDSPCILHLDCSGIKRKVSTILVGPTESASLPCRPLKRTPFPGERSLSPLVGYPHSPVQVQSHRKRIDRPK